MSSPVQDPFETSPNAQIVQPPPSQQDITAQGANDLVTTSFSSDASAGTETGGTILRPLDGEDADHSLLVDSTHAVGDQPPVADPNDFALSFLALDIISGNIPLQDSSTRLSPDQVSHLNLND